MLMSNLKPGEKVRVIKIKGSQLERRLYELGIIHGSDIELVSLHPFKGPLVLKVGNTTLALGHDIAELIEVEEM